MNHKIRYSYYIKLVFFSFLFLLIGYELYKSVNELKSEPEFKSFFSKDLLSAKQIQIQAGTNHIDLVKDNNDWKIVKPIHDFVDLDLVSNWLKSILASNTEAMPSDYKYIDWDQYGLSDPMARILFKLGNGDNLQIEIGSTRSFKQEFYLKSIYRNSTRLLLSDMPWLNFVLKKPIDFVSSKNILNFDFNKIIKFKINNLDDFNYKNGLWNYSGPEKIDPARVAGLLHELKKLKIKFLDSSDVVISKKTVFNLELFFLNKNNDVVKVYDHFKDCMQDSVMVKCQLMSSTSSRFPFWVLESDLKVILDKSSYSKLQSD